jgi:hypothetical protein
LTDPLHCARRKSTAFFGDRVEYWHKRSETQGLQSRADFRNILPAPEDLPERFRLAIDFPQQECLGQDDAPRPNRKNKEDRDNTFS